MKTFLRIATIGALILMACKEDSIALDALKQSFCAPDAAFPATSALTAEDAAIQAKYGAACTSIHRLNGLQFKDTKQAYLCRTSLINEGAEIQNGPAHAKVMATFPEAETGDILARYGFTGKDFAVVVLDGKPLTMMAALKPLLASVNSAEAAMAWAYLQGVLGAGYQPQALCKAASLTENGSGWSVEKAEKPMSCKPVRWVSFNVNRAGAINVTQETDMVNPDGTKSVICVD